MATDESKAKADDEQQVDQAALGLSKHLTSWRESYGDDVVDEAVKLSADQRKAAADERAKAVRADAARERALAGQQRDAAPANRTTTDTKTAAKT